MKIWISIIFVGLVVSISILLFSPTTKGQKEFKDEPTVVTKGQATNEERAYSQEYKKQYSVIASAKLTDLSESEQASGIEVGASIGKEKPFFLGIEEPPHAQEFLRKLVCEADAVVLGSPFSKTSHLTDDETFIYSQYEVQIKRVFKNNAIMPTKSDSIINLTRPGGLIKVDSQVIRVEDKNFEPLRSQKEYVLFLRYIPTARGYMISEHDGDFVLDGDKVNGLSNMEIPEYIGRNLPSKAFFRDLDLAVARGCGESK